MDSIKKGLGIFSSLLLVLALVAMAVLPAPSLATTYPITLTDDLGREVTIGAPPERIISLAPSITEILFALDLANRIVGVTDFCDYPPEVLGKETIGGPWTPSIESIVALEPDLVLAEEINPIDVINALAGQGLTVFGIKSTDLDDLLNDIDTVGQITDQEVEAAALTANMQSRIDAVTAKTAGLSPEEKSRTFHICWHSPVWTVGQDTFIHSLIEKAGGTNIFADLEGYNTVSLEALIDRDPEVIIVTAMGGTASETWSWVNTEPLLEDVSARQNGRVYFVESNWVERPGPRIVLGLEQIAGCIHPEIFLAAVTPSGGGGGGGGGDLGYSYLAGFTGEGGVTNMPIQARSEDGIARFTIPTGTQVIDEFGNAVSYIIMKEAIEEYCPPPSENAQVVGEVYIFASLYEVTFDPPVNLTFFYNESLIPEGMDEGNLVIAYWDEELEEWVPLEGCVVNLEANTVEAPLGHFSLYAVIARSKPAAFTVSNLSISPVGVNTGESAAITVLVTNTGELAGTYEAALKIDGTVERTKTVTLDGGASETISFSISPDIAGEYDVEIGGLVGNFTVIEPPAPAAFTTSELTVYPPEVYIGESVTISLDVSNTGELAGTYTITLKINGAPVEGREVTLEGGGAQTVAFTTARDTAGTYTVDVGGQTGSFEVKKESAPVSSVSPTPTATISTPAPTTVPSTSANWVLVGGIMAAVVVIVIVTAIIQRRRDW